MHPAALGFIVEVAAFAGGSDACMSFSAFPLCGCIRCRYLRRLLQAGMAAATTSNKYWLIPDVLAR